MKNPKNGKEKKRIGYNYLGMAGIMVIALVLLGSLMLQSKTLERRRDYYDSKATALEKSIESEKERTKIGKTVDFSLQAKLPAFQIKMFYMKSFAFYG